MKIKSISHPKSISKKNPILKHKLQNAPVNTHTLKKEETKHNALTVREHGRAVKLVLDYYNKGGISVKNALDKSLKVDIVRAMTQLRVFYIRSFRKNVFFFTVKASGLYEETSHQVELSWKMDKANMEDSPKEIFLNTPIQFQCGCGRHKYWYKYMATKGGWNLGYEENRFPSVRNQKNQGCCCKHVIIVLKTIHSPAFQGTFERYVENYKMQKQTRVSFKDKSKIAGSSFNAN